jgi:20S proteasome alpha/beta subunit
LTAVIGAKCSDGIVLIADRKLMRKNGEAIYREKIFADLRHVIIGYTGDVEMFDIFRRYTVGDVMILRDDMKRYTSDNLLSRVSNSIKQFNGLVGCRPFKVLLVSLLENPPEMYHIDLDGSWNKVSYESIGSGSAIANMFCSTLDHQNIKMKDFTKHAYLAIDYMDSTVRGLEWDSNHKAHQILNICTITKKKK